MLQREKKGIWVEFLYLHWGEGGRNFELDVAEIVREACGICSKMRIYSGTEEKSRKSLPILLST